MIVGSWSAAIRSPRIEPARTDEHAPEEHGIRLGINGFGRIGRQVFRMAYEQEGLEVVHINDVTEAGALASLLQFDTTYGG